MSIIHCGYGLGLAVVADNLNGIIEYVQKSANHEVPRIAKLYDRTNDAISPDEIEE